jgi:hypothetical protein
MKGSLRALFPLLALVLLAPALACTNGQPTVVVSATTSPTTAPGATVSPPTTASPTIAPITNCAQLSTFAGAGPASGGANFPDVPFPGGSVSAAASASTTIYQFWLVPVCTNTTIPAAVQSFYASALPGAGWSQSASYPYGGDPTRACGDPYCWRLGGPPVRYVSLESVAAKGTVTTYTLRLALAPNPSAQVVTHAMSASGSTAGTALSATASCASGEQMVSGGYYVQSAGGYPAFTPHRNFPSGVNAWTASVVINGATTLYAHVECVKANFALHMQWVHQTASVAPGAAKVVGAPCPSGTVLTGGGYQITQTGLAWVVASVPASEGWGLETQVDSVSGSPVSETVYAGCAQNLSATTGVVNTVTVPTAGISSNTADCSGGQLLTGGGFDEADTSGSLVFFKSELPSPSSPWSVQIVNVGYPVAAHDAHVWSNCHTLTPRF